MTHPIAELSTLGRDAAGAAVRRLKEPPLSAKQHVTGDLLIGHVSASAGGARPAAADHSHVTGGGRQPPAVAAAQQADPLRGAEAELEAAQPGLGGTGGLAVGPATGGQSEVRRSCLHGAGVHAGVRHCHGTAVTGQWSGIQETGGW